VSEWECGGEGGDEARIKKEKRQRRDLLENRGELLSGLLLFN
jgi:hypothetical protein